MDGRERICRFCFGNCDTNFKAIEKSTRVILDMLLIKKNLGVTDEPVMCTNCAEILQKCFEFKSNCLRNTLTDSYLDRRKNEFISGPSDRVVCGFCIGLVKNSSFAILDIDEDNVKEKIMLEKCLPELDLITTKKLVICAACHESLQSYFYFITNSMIAEEKIERYRQGKDLIVLNNVRRCILGNKCEEEGNECDGIDVTKSENLISTDLQLTFENIKEDDTNVNIVKLEDAICDEIENKTECQPEMFVEMENRVFNDVTSEDMLPWKEDSDKVDVVKQEEFCLEAENDLTCVVNVKEETFLPRDDEEIDMKRDQHEISSDTILERRPSGHSKPKIFSCRVCPFKSNAKYRLLVHVANKHKEEATKRALPPAACIALGNGPDDILYKCVDCPYTTKMKNRLHKHLLSHQMPPDGDTLRKIHKCPHCDYQSKVRVNWRQHIRNVHKPVQLMKCDKCSFETRHKRSIMMHMATHNDARKVYKCPLCPFETHLLQTLKYRHQLTHKSDEEVRIHQCKFCPHKSKTKGDLKKHALTHKSLEEITMFKCDACLYQTKFRFCLTRHQLTHQAPQAVDKLYPCNLCDYQGRTTRHLGNHFRNVHRKLDDDKMHKCTECPYQSCIASALKRHLLRHKPVEERARFPCDSCGFQSTSKQGLRIHCSNMHSNPEEMKKFACVHCGFQATFNGNLKRHMQIHEKGI